MEKGPYNKVSRFQNGMIVRFICVPNNNTDKMCLQQNYLYLV